MGTATVERKRDDVLRELWVGYLRQLSHWQLRRLQSVSAGPDG
jgi:hypothetical protein